MVCLKNVNLNEAKYLLWDLVHYLSSAKIESPKKVFMNFTPAKIKPAIWYDKGVIQASELSKETII